MLFPHHRYTANQVIGGRWKPTHYLYESVLCRDVFASCGRDGRCYVKNDNALSAFEGTVRLSLIQPMTGARTSLLSFDISLEVGANALHWFCASGTDFPNCTQWASLLPTLNCSASGADCVLLIDVIDSTGTEQVSNPTLLSNPGNLTLPKTNVVFTVGAHQHAGQPVPIRLHTDGPAFFVSLTTLASGRFSNSSINLFSSGGYDITFLPFDDFNYDQLVQTLRIEHLAQYLQ